MEASEQSNQRQPTIYIVDDDPSIRKALRLVAESAGYQVETYESAELFLQQIPRTLYGCLLLDLRLGGMSGLQLLKQMRENHLNIPTLMITGHGDVPAAVMSMKLGAVEFLEKPLDNQTLLDHILDAVSLSEKLVNQQQQNNNLQNQFSTLSPREVEILKHIISGKSTKQIAYATGLSHKTVSNHRARLLAKTGADNTADLVRRALEVGIS